jgi:fatty-acyl-CoA synthase
MISAESARRRQSMDARHEVWRWSSLPAYLDWSCEDYAARELVLTDLATFSYADVAGISQRLSAGLRAAGARKGDRVGVFMANDPITVPLLFAIWRAGCAAVPLNTLYRIEELSYALREAGCAYLVTMRGFGSRDVEGEIDAAHPGWRSGACSDLPELRGGFVFDRDRPEAFAAQLENSGKLEEDVAVVGNDTAVIMFTSGTTGSPKGVEITHDNLLRAAYAGAYHQAFEDGRRAVFSLPLYHGFGLVVGLLSGLVVGGAIVPLLKFDPHTILTAIGRHRATYLMGVPTMTIALMEQARRGEYDFSSLTAIHSAAAPTPSWVWDEMRKVFGCDEIITSYGQTELTATVVCTAPGDSIEVVSETQGRIVEAGIAGMPDCEGRIADFKTVDPVTGDDLPWGAAGELCCRSPMNSKGYFRRPEATSAISLPGGWIRTGDLGQFREDGNLFLTGRTKELYKSRGELVSPKELEQLLTTHDAVAQAFFIGMPDDRYGECGCAWVVLSEERALAEEEVRDFLSARLPAYKLPRDIWFIADADLPKTGTGKVQKAVLREMAFARLSADCNLPSIERAS